MKVKLKKGEKLTSNYSYCYLDRGKWAALNQGKEGELDSVPKMIENQVEQVGSSNTSPQKKGDK